MQASAFVSLRDIRGTKGKLDMGNNQVEQAKINEYQWRPKGISKSNINMGEIVANSQMIVSSQ